MINPGLMKNARITLSSGTSTTDNYSYEFWGTLSSIHCGSLATGSITVTTSGLGEPILATTSMNAFYYPRIHCCNISGTELTGSVFDTIKICEEKLKISASGLTSGMSLDVFYT